MTDCCFRLAEMDVRVAQERIAAFHAERQRLDDDLRKGKLDDKVLETDAKSLPTAEYLAGLVTSKQSAKALVHRAAELRPQLSFTLTGSATGGTSSALDIIATDVVVALATPTIKVAYPQMGCFSLYPGVRCCVGADCFSMCVISLDFSSNDDGDQVVQAAVTDETGCVSVFVREAVASAHQWNLVPQQHKQSQTPEPTQLRYDLKLTDTSVALATQPRVRSLLAA